MTGTREILEAVFREERGRIIAALIRLSGSFDRAEEAMQDAFASALAHWNEHGIPASPGAWITSAAHRRVIDMARRDSTRRRLEPAVAYSTPALSMPEEIALAKEMQYPDDRLRLIFTCCHPALSLEAQVALTLRMLGGLTTPEIARAFLLPEATVAQRIVRAKRKIQDARIPYVVPSRDDLAGRVAAVQAVLYLIFNEGYTAASGSTLIRPEICREAIRLTRMLCALLPEDPENQGLLALMLLQDSRRDARVSASGDLVTLEHQDRTKWDRAQIEEGLALLEPAIKRRPTGPYRLQAAIAAVHAEAATPAGTGWRQIAGLYAELARIHFSPVVELNRAAAVAMCDGPERGLALLEPLSAELDGYAPFHAVRAGLLARLARHDEAAAAFARALELTPNAVEQRFLRTRLDQLAAGSVK